MKNRGYYIYLIFIAVMAIVLFGCKTQRPSVIEVPVQYKERIVERLVRVDIPADSSNFYALMECDSTNQVILKELGEEKSKRMKSLFSFDAGVIKYKVKTVRDTVFVTAKDSIIYREIPITVEIPIEVNRITAWQKLQMNAGRLLLLILVLYAIYTVYKWKFKV